MEWIKCEEQLPQREVLAINIVNDYLIGYVSAGTTVGNAILGKTKSKFVCESDGETLADVTHWMHLPSPPKT